MKQQIHVLSHFQVQTSLGAVLLQNERLVTFHSYKLSSAERSYLFGEQAVVTALRQWHCHLDGAKRWWWSLTTSQTPSWTVSLLCSLVHGKHDGKSFCHGLTSGGSAIRGVLMLLTLSVAALHC